MVLAVADAPRYQPLVVVAAAQSVGIAVDRFANPGFATWFVVCGAALSAWSFGWRKRWLAVSSCALCVAIVGLSGAWHARMWRWFDRDDIGLSISGEPRGVVAEVVARTSPRIVPAARPDPLNVIPRGDRTRMEVEFERVRARGAWIPASGRCVLTVEGRVVGVVAGDRLRVTAVASRWEPPANPGEANFGEYARGERRLFRWYAESSSAVHRLRGEPVWRWRPRVEQFRERVRQRLCEHIPVSQAGLSAAMLLGTREGLDPESVELFFVTGVSHLIAISGLNVAIFSYGFWWVARSGLFSRRVALVLAMALAVGYAVITESQSPVVRAAVLVVCVCFARIGSRRNAGFNTLAMAAICVLAIQPSALFQAGTQLSFLAVAVLIVVDSGWPQTNVDPLDQLVAQLQPWPVRGLRRLGVAFWELFCTSAWVWFVALPLVWYRFQLISPIALLMNPLVVLPMALALYFGFATLVGSCCSTTIANAFGWACGACLSFIESVLQLGTHLPGNHLWLPAPSVLWVLAWYATLVLWRFLPNLPLPRRWQFAAVLMMIASGLWSARLVPSMPKEELTCTFVAVGHGTAVLVELPGGLNLLYDAGHLGNPITATQSLSACMWSKGITHLDAIVLSHADLDHYNAVPALLERFSVGVVYASPTMLQDHSPSLDVLWHSIRSRGIRLRPLREGHSLVVGRGGGWMADISGHQPATDRDVSMRVLHPPEDGVLGSDNANSVVLLIEYDGCRVLLTGDLEAAGMDRLLESEPLRCDLVMAPHHGSRFSDPQRFLAWSMPQWVVASCSRRSDGRTLRFECDALEIGCLRTVDDGAVEFRVGADGRTLRCFRWPASEAIELSR